MTMDGPVLVSWVSKHHDPYDGGDPARGPGPNLMLLFDPSSAYARRIRDVVLLYRQEAGEGGREERNAYLRTRRAIQERDAGIRVEGERWSGSDPTDHRAVFEFLREVLPRRRRTCPDRELVLHVSPGPPSMQTVMVLMAETGFVAGPFTAVRSFRPEDRRGPDAVAPVSLGLETFYKVYQASRARRDVDAVAEVGLAPRPDAGHERPAVGRAGRGRARHGVPGPARRELKRCPEIYCAPRLRRRGSPRESSPTSK
jgi:hypothetical protein